MLKYTREFDSVAECVEFLIRMFPDMSFARGPATVPRYLFRGECGIYETTVPLNRRLPAELDDTDREQIGALVEYTFRQLIDFERGSRLSPEDARGLIQHLGLPTPYIDFTRSVEVAAAFAAWGCEDKNPGSGCICVLDMQEAIVSDRIHVARLYPVQFFERANRQKAFGFAHLDHPDLKSTEGAAASKAQWYRFTIGEKDRTRYRDAYRSLLDTCTDPGAGLLRWLVNTYVAANNKKLRSRVAQYCVKSIPMVPLIGRQHTQWQPGGTPKWVELLLPGDLEKWNLRHERLQSLRFWSEDFPDTLDLNFQPAATDGTVVFPATYHPLPTQS